MGTVEVGHDIDFGFASVFARPFVNRFALCYRTVVLSVCLSVTFVHYGQTVGRIKMKLGMQVGLGPDHMWPPSSPSPKWAQPPIFGPYLLWPNGCMDKDAAWYGGKPWPRRPCIRWGPRSPSPKRSE